MMGDPILVECRCGWRDYSDKLVERRPGVAEKHCPECGETFRQWPSPDFGEIIPFRRKKLTGFIPDSGDHP